MNFFWPRKYTKGFVGGTRSIFLFVQEQGVFAKTSWWPYSTHLKIISLYSSLSCKFTSTFCCQIWLSLNHKKKLERKRRLTSLNQGPIFAADFPTEAPVFSFLSSKFNSMLCFFFFPNHAHTVFWVCKKRRCLIEEKTI